MNHRSETARRSLRGVRIFGRVLGILLIAALVLPAVLWSCLMIGYNFPIAGLCTAAAWGFGIATVAAFAFLPRRRRTLVGFGIAFGLLWLWWLAIPPSNDREWSSEYAVLPHATYEGNLVTVHHVRNFEYRSPEDFDVRHYTRTYDLDQLATLDLSFIYWTSEAIAHTILSFGFAGGEYLAVSIETRREKDEPWSSIGGFFQQFEIAYVIADERDVLRLRTNFRHEEVYVYPLRSTPAQIRTVLRSVLDKVNALAEKPQFYNTITHNCTTSLVPHFAEAHEVKASWLEVLINGYGDRVVFENGNMDTDLSFEETKRRHHANPHVLDDPSPVDYSKRIRPFRYASEGKGTDRDR
jgi:hypothetical protein